MEQLSQNAVRHLLAKARSSVTPGREPVPGLPPGLPPDLPPDLPRAWVDPAVHEAPGQPGGPAMSLPAESLRAGPFSPAASPETSPETSSVERRLVRRAEALWTRLAEGVPLLSEGAPLPLADRADELLRPPFAAQGLMLEMPAGLPASLSFVGDTLARLSSLSPGSAEDSAISTRLGARLVGIARRAATLGEPCHYDSDEDRAAALAEGADSQLLMRAIALPLSGVRGGAQGATAVVIASWRKLLSAEETRALHRELAAAMDWMHRQGS